VVATDLLHVRPRRQGLSARRIACLTSTTLSAWWSTTTRSARSATRRGA